MGRRRRGGARPSEGVSELCVWSSATHRSRACPREGCYHGNCRATARTPARGASERHSQGPARLSLLQGDSTPVLLYSLILRQRVSRMRRLNQDELSTTDATQRTMLDVPAPPPPASPRPTAARPSPSSLSPLSLPAPSGPASAQICSMAESLERDVAAAVASGVGATGVALPEARALALAVAVVRCMGAV